MPYGPTARLGLSGPLGTEMINQGDDSIRALLDRLDAVLAPVSSGLFANRPVSTPGSPGIVDRLYHATDAFAAFRDTGTGWEIRAQTPQIVSALPSGGGLPFDGQEVYYLADATKGIVWHLRYRAASTSTYKWEVIGAAELSERGTYVASGGGDFSTSSTTYIDVPGMSGITLPLAGDYAVDYGFTELRSDTNGQSRWWGVVLNTGTPPIEHFYQSNVVSDFGRGSHYTLDWTGLAAASVLRLRVRTSGVGVAVFNGGHLRIRPIRVG